MSQQWRISDIARPLSTVSSVWLRRDFIVLICSKWRVMSVARTISITSSRKILSSRSSAACQKGQVDPGREIRHAGQQMRKYRYSSLERPARMLESSVRMILKAELTCRFSRTARSLYRIAVSDLEFSVSCGSASASTHSPRHDVEVVSGSRVLKVVHDGRDQDCKDLQIREPALSSASAWT